MNLQNQCPRINPIHSDLCQWHLLCMDILTISYLTWVVGKPGYEIDGYYIYGTTAEYIKAGYYVNDLVSYISSWTHKPVSTRGLLNRAVL